MLGIEGEYPAPHSEKKIDSCRRKMQKINCKTFPWKIFFT